jgi:hypothetical protein
LRELISDGARQRIGVPRGSSFGFFVFAWTDDTGGNKMIAAINLITNRLISRVPMNTPILVAIRI